MSLGTDKAPIGLCLIAGLIGLSAGCTRQSDFKRELATAVEVATATARALEAGTITYGDFQKLDARIKEVSQRMATTSIPNAADRNEFDRTWSAFQSGFDLLGDQKFLHERLDQMGAGGISPAFTASVGTEDIAKMQDYLQRVTKLYEKAN